MHVLGPQLRVVRRQAGARASVRSDSSSSSSNASWRRRMGTSATLAVTRASALVGRLRRNAHDFSPDQRRPARRSWHSCARAAPGCPSRSPTGRCRRRNPEGTGTPSRAARAGRSSAAAGEVRIPVRNVAGHARPVAGEAGHHRQRLAVAVSTRTTCTPSSTGSAWKTRLTDTPATRPLPEPIRAGTSAWNAPYTAPAISSGRTAA